jgi:hypothetical protein
MSLKDVQLKEYYISGVDNLVKKFYVPVLEQSVLYQRRTGYFNSRALAMAARGLSGLLKNDGKMQLICSVELEESERAVLENPVGYLERRSIDIIEALEQPSDQLERIRLALLAELIARGKLEIKIAIPHAGGVYHEKAGIFRDRDGNIVAFNGSGNETPGGWLRNTESFHAYTSWSDPRHIKPEIRTFDALWNHELPGTTVMPLPEAVRRKLLQFRKPEYFYGKNLDEPIDPIDEGIVEIADWEWTPELAYVFEAPRLWNHTDFAFGEVAVTPFEHQDYVASSVLTQWPPRFMLCDEVGLGKTIEAGLILRGFLSAGRVDRILILAPKNILKQWQLQLLTKFNIVSWRLDGNYVLGPQPDPDVPPEKEKVDADNPFRTKPIMLVSSQLIRSERRRNQLLGLEYDLVVLDEAHHARARGASGRREPNLLLEAMELLKLQTQGTLFLTATPIQLSRKELWDLLMILEMPGKWQDEDLFDRFYVEINKKRPDWAFLFDIVQSSIQTWGVDQSAVRDLRDAYPSIDVDQLMQTVKDARYHVASSLDAPSQEVIKLLLYRHTPVYRMVFRNTRELLRKYHEEGKFKEKLAERAPQPPDKIRLTGSRDDPRSEFGLYCRIEEYIREYYAKYESVRKGLGFLMEVYRKRLTSSFFSMKKSLERRKETLDKALESGEFSVIVKEAEEDEGLDLNEPNVDRLITEIEEGYIAVTDKDLEHIRTVLQNERDYLEGFLSDLRDLPFDTKAEYLHTLLRGKFDKGTRRVIIFSQFADTVEFLLDYLKPHYGERLGSYTGEGGSYWDEHFWHRCSKQKIQEKFTDDDDVLSILVCTDAASEGLDLQSCDTLVNYDIPWNPMRIEQRIGRIDRIGQKSPIVTIHTLYYDGTVEERVYARCLERIDNFRVTLGHLQPILATERLIREAALAKNETEAEKILGQLDEEFSEKSVAEKDEEIRILKLCNEYVPQLQPQTTKTPVSQRQLEAFLGERLKKAGWRKEDEYWTKEGSVVTFSPKVVDLRSRAARLITPLSNLSQFFGSLPSIPETIAGSNGGFAHRIETDGLTTFVSQRGTNYSLVDAIGDFEKPSGHVFSSLEECRSEALRLMNEQKKGAIESQIISWENRLLSWNVRARMYIDKVAVWKWRGDLMTSFGSFDDAKLVNSWQQYVEDSERRSLSDLSRISSYRPDPSSMRLRARGRPPKTSPRSTIREDQFIKERRMVQERMKVLKEQLDELSRAR